MPKKSKRTGEFLNVTVAGAKPLNDYLGSWLLTMSEKPDRVTATLTKLSDRLGLVELRFRDEPECSGGNLVIDGSRYAYFVNRAGDPYTAEEIQSAMDCAIEHEQEERSRPNKHAQHLQFAFLAGVGLTLLVRWLIH